MRRYIPRGCCAGLGSAEAHAGSACQDPVDTCTAVCEAKAKACAEVACSGWRPVRHVCVRPKRFLCLGLAGGEARACRLVAPRPRWRRGLVIFIVLTLLRLGLTGSEGLSQFYTLLIF